MGGGGGVDPLQELIQRLVANGGAYWIPHPIVLGEQSLFQDEAMTVPSSVDGDPVGVVRDMSGNGHHLVAPSSAARPVYRTDGASHWLDADGVDDSFTVASSGEDLAFQMPYTYQFTLLNPSIGETYWVYEKESDSPWNTLVTRGDGRLRATVTTSDQGTIDRDSDAIFEAGRIFTAKVMTNSGSISISLDGDDPAFSNITGTIEYTTQSARVLRRERESTPYFFAGRFYGGFVVASEVTPEDSLLASQYMGNDYS